MNIKERAMHGEALIASWSKREKDIVATGTRASTALFFTRLMNPVHQHEFIPSSTQGYETLKSFTDELKARGYDITTFKFSIEKLRIEK